MTSNTPETPVYATPLRFRRLENLHILFWLIKDICWCVGFAPLGIAMIFPTLLVGLYITWRTRNILSELVHNLAVIFWIIANSLWMIFEFMERDDVLKYYCLIPFGIGLSILIVYYVNQAVQNRGKAKRKIELQVEAEPSLAKN